MYTFHERKVIMRIRARACETPDELLESTLFREVVQRSLAELTTRQSILLEMFGEQGVSETSVDLLINTFRYLDKLPIEMVVKLVPGATVLFQNRHRLQGYVEFLYDYWRSFDRFIICDSEADELDQRPYRTFNETVEVLTHLVRQVYRDIAESITGEHPNVFRQIRAGAGMAAIALPKPVPMPAKYATKLGSVPIMRQIMINPPLVLDPPMNKRKGQFERIDNNPIDHITLNPQEWLCYPVKAGELTILTYIHQCFYELGFSLANLFEIATDDDLAQQPDAIYVFGVPGDTCDRLGHNPTVFYEDLENRLVVAAAPGRPEFGYFGYLKKFILTLHNIVMIRRGRLPYHGSFTKIILRGGKEMSVLIIGDTGTGKSETLEAFRLLGSEKISDITIIADDMGSLGYDDAGEVIGYGTEIGAFLRLDDLSPGTAFGTIDRAIFMSTGQVNSRVVIPVTSLGAVLEGARVDMLLYANNYESVDDDHPVIRQFDSPGNAIDVFSAGKAMSKGTTASTGLVTSYYANIFGPPEYIPEHDVLASEFFGRLFERGVYVGEILTQLGIPGQEHTGPELVAKALIQFIEENA
jgi:hypothetical protein